MTFLCQSTIDRFTSAFLIDTFTVQSFSLSGDSSGGQTQSWSDLTTGVAGYLEQSKYRSFEAMTGEHQQGQRRFLVLLEQGTTVTEAHRLKQTHANGSAITPRYFKIITVIDGETIDVTVNIEAIELPGVN